MKWYVEERNMFGQYAPALYADYPEDRSVSGVKRSFQVRVEIAPEHREFPFEALVAIYGTKMVVPTEKPA